MQGQSGTVSGAANPPFATPDGKPIVTDGAGAGAAIPVSRPQPSGPPQLDISKGEMPAKGGIVLLADPSGGAGDPKSLHPLGNEVPFKNLK